MYTKTKWRTELYLCSFLFQCHCVWNIKEKRNGFSCGLQSWGQFTNIFYNYLRSKLYADLMSVRIVDVPAEIRTVQFSDYEMEMLPVEPACLVSGINNACRLILTPAISFRDVTWRRDGDLATIPNFRNTEIFGKSLGRSCTLIALFFVLWCR
jgi:hypothetical protein